MKTLALAALASLAFAPGAAFAIDPSHLPDPVHVDPHQEQQALGGAGGAATSTALSLASTSSEANAVSQASTSSSANGNGAGQTTTVNQSNRYRRNAVSTAIGAGATTWACGKTIGVGGQAMVVGGSLSIPIGTSSYCAILSAVQYTDNPGCFARVLVISKMTGRKRSDVLKENENCPPIPLQPAAAPLAPTPVSITITTPPASTVTPKEDGERG